MRRLDLMTHLPVRLTWLLLAAFVLSSCATQHAPLRSSSDTASADARPSDADSEVFLAATDGKPPMKAEVTEGTGTFINEAAASKPRKRISSDGDVTFNFDNAPVPAVVQTILGELLQENYVIAPGVGGTVTFSTAKPVKADQAFSILEMLLSWNNASITYQEGRYLVSPTATAIQGNLAPRVGSADNAIGYEVRAVPLQFIAATEMEKLLQPFARQGAILRADNTRQLIIVSGSRQELTNYLDTIETFDVDYLQGMSFGLYPMEEVEAKDVATDLEAIFGAGADSPLAGILKFSAIERLNAILVVSPQRKYLEEAQKWIKKFDRASGGDGGAQLYVYEVRNVSALDLADSLNAIFTGQAQPRRERTDRGRLAPGQQGGTLGSPNTGGLQGQQIQRAAQPVQQQAATPAATGDEKGLLADQDVRITAMEDTNSLLIQAKPSAYGIIKQAVKRLDVQAPQVLVEAKLLEVTLTSNLSYGVQWFLESGIGLAGGIQAPGTTGAGLVINPAGRGSSLQSTAGVINGAGSLFQFDSRNVRAILSALEAETDIKVVSSPSLLVGNNREAQINIGQQIPIEVGGLGSIGAGNGVVNQQFTQYRDTGVTLAVTPRINKGGLVFLTIEAEVSSPQVNAGSTGGNPAINRTLISTEVTIENGMTVMLGGLITNSNSVTKSGLPFLSRLPVVGGLFGRRANDGSRGETLLMITTTVVQNSHEAAELTSDFRAGLRGIESILRAEEKEKNARRQRAEAN